MGGSRNGAGRSKLCAWRVTGGFHTSTAERGRQWRRALRDVHGGWRFKATTPQLPADAGARWPRRLRVVHGHPTVTPLLGFGPRSPLSSGTSPLQREQLGARFWLFWLLAGLGIRKGYGATHTDSYAQDGTTGRKGQLRVWSSEGTESLSFDNR